MTRKSWFTIILYVFLSFTVYTQDTFTLDEVKSLSKIVGLAWSPLKHAPEDLVLPSRYFPYTSSENSSLIENGAIVVNLIEKQVVISLPGTLNLPDFFVDLKIVHKSLGWLKGASHAGFYNEFENVLTGLLPAFDAISKDIGCDIKECSVLTLGHSKGGSVAQILAAYLYKELGFKNIRVLTVAAPKVFNKEAKQGYNNILGMNTLHVIERSDIVPHLPPNGLGFERTGWILYVDCPMGYIFHRLEGYNEALELMKPEQFKICKEKTFPSFAVFKFKLSVFLQGILGWILGTL